MAIFSPVSGKLLSTLKVTPSSIVKQIIFSRSGLDMIVNSSDRVIRLYSVESVDEENEDGEAGEEEPAPEIEAEGKFLDSVDRIQWFDCCISADGEYVVGGMFAIDSRGSSYALAPFLLVSPLLQPSKEEINMISTSGTKRQVF